MKVLLGTLVATVFAFSNYALSQSEVNEGAKSSSSSQSSSGQGTKKGAGAAKAAQMIGAGANIAMGVAMIKPCAAQPSCPYCCAAAAMSFANAATMFADSQQSAGVEDMAGVDLPDFGGVFDGPGFLGPDGKPINSAEGLNGAITSGLAEASGYGYDYNPETGLLTTPDNGTFSPEVLNDPAAAAAQGFSASDMAFGQGEMLAVSDKFNAKLAGLDKANRPSVSGMGFDGGGGGGGSSFKGIGYDSSSMTDYLARMKRGIASNKKAVIAGKSKNYGGEQIGVKVDNLFEMVHRRYQSKRKENNFLENIVTKKK